MAAYWEICIFGDNEDLQLVVGVCSDESWEIRKKDEMFYLRLTKKPAEEPHAAHERAIRRLTNINALSRLRFPGYGKLVAGNAVNEVASDGNCSVNILCQPAKIQLRTFPATIQIGNDVILPSDGLAELANIAEYDKVLEKVLRLRNSEALEWVDLYRIFEVIESDVGKNRCTNNGWIANEDLKLFKHTANSVEAAGDMARHGKEPNKPPKNPMQLQDARTIIDDLINHWLIWKSQTNKVLK